MPGITPPLSPSELVKTVSQLNNWAIVDGKLHQRFSFRDFNEALGFIVRVGLLAEQQDHHPTIHNTYNTVDLFLISHDVEAISSRDVQLAESVSALLG
jgi:4a-hydroxytetrahydrobiopterin dehydratase